MSSSSSSVAQPEKCNDTNVAVEESREKAMENNNSALGSDPQEVMSERRSENPCLGSGAVPTENGFMQRCTSESTKIYTCRFCDKRFSAPQGLSGHMNSHRKEVQWEKKRKEMEQEFHHRWSLSRCSQDALSNDNNLGITFGPFKRSCTGLYPSFNTGLTDMNVVPRMAPTCLFTGNTFTNGSSSGELGLVPSYNSYPPIFPGNVPAFPPLGTNNLPSYLFPQENVLNEEDVILKLGNDNVVETDDDDYDDDDAADQPEEGTSKSWGADLSLSL
ncbi:hypothetical protein Bca4012_067431 [Brassica carinata]|uniref:C2H2-type domain-containing protein n=1 Tax=Brassica carinata TaxID=52824 RepID=A0A8X7VSH6_BRACI|nr:hypothetical protein Bca52824_019693 [Brassica carinata]